MTSYPAGTFGTASSGPAAWYAFSAANARFYILTADWSDNTTGSATGGTCGTNCKSYQVDADQHWQPNNPEYQWLKADLAAHPGGLKFAVFHYPLRSDDASQPSDTFLQNTPGSSGTLEQLLHDNGVDIAFNGHAHIYQRNTPPAGGIISYVTGGGGAKLVPVNHCSATDAYALGWSYSTAKGSKCGSAPTPTSPSQVFNYLLVNVSAGHVTVSPKNAAGQTFDQQSYNFPG
jgi:hypothetical protein